MGLVLLDEALLLEQRVEDAVDRVGGTELLLQPRAPALRRDDDGQVSRTKLGDPALVEDERDPGREVRLADDEAAPPADLDDDPL